jgi:hypothetical protein
MNFASYASIIDACRESQIRTAPQDAVKLQATARDCCNDSQLNVPPSLGFEARRSDEGVQRTRGDIQDLGDRRLGDFLAQQHLDLAYFPIEF